MWNNKLLLRSFLLLLLTAWITGFLFPLITSSHNIFSEYLLKRFYSTVCHQDGKRCINFGYDYMLVCARCAGIYFGAFLVGIISLNYKMPDIKTKVFIVSALPLLLDVILVFLRFYKYSKSLTLSTGLIFGSVVYLIIISEIEKIILKLSVVENG